MRMRLVRVQDGEVVDLPSASTVRVVPFNESSVQLVWFEEVDVDGE